MKQSSVLMLAVLFMGFGVMKLTQARTEELPRYQCHRVADKITIDGVLDERSWSEAPPITLVLWNGKGTPKRSTTAKMVWDDENLYIGYWVEDDDIQCTLTERDAPLHTEDVVEFFLDPGGDLRDYFEFEWNALGACMDLLIKLPPATEGGKVPPREALLGWNACGMKWAVHVDGEIGKKEKSQGWTLEVAIPLAVFSDARRVPPKDGDEWRMNVYRIEYSDPEVEYTCWSAVLGGSVSFHRPERFGHLVFTARKP